MKFGIAIENLHLQAIIGILPFERENAQEIAVDLEAVYENAEFDAPNCHSEGAKRPKNPRIKNDSFLDSSLRATHYAQNDEGSGIVNYAILREIILDSFKQNEFFYLESALVAIQSAILEKFPQILELNLSVKKLEIFSDCIPKVRLSWQKGEKLQGLDCHENSLCSFSRNDGVKVDCFGDSCESHRNDGK